MYLVKRFLIKVDLGRLQSRAIILKVKLFIFVSYYKLVLELNILFRRILELLLRVILLLPTKGEGAPLVVSSSLTINRRLTGSNASDVKRRLSIS